MDNITKLVLQLEKKLPDLEKENQLVSVKPIGWHIQHSLLVVQQIIISLKQSNPKEYKWKFNFWRLVVMGKNKIPRGKGKAPSRVLPKEEITEQTLNDAIKNTKIAIKELGNLERDHFFTHPFFGDLNLKPAKKFIALHTQHHIDIINDILKN